MEEEKLRLKIDINDYEHYGLGFLKKKNTFANEFIEEYIIKELLELQKLADDNGIAILFLKGLIERYDTYLPLDLYRDYGDIDILVSQDDVYDFCALCERLNFKTSNGAINNGLNQIFRTWIGIICHLYQNQYSEEPIKSGLKFIQFYRQCGIIQMNLERIRKI